MHDGDKAQVSLLGDNGAIASLQLIVKVLLWLTAEQVLLD